jgi:hypothetical protein
VNNLRQGDTYNFRLYSMNQAHLSLPLVVAYQVGILPTEPLPMTHVRSAIGTIGNSDSEIEIAWKPVDDYDNLRIKSYQLYIDDGNGVFGAPITLTVFTTYTYTFTGLNDSVAYQFMIAAGNDIGYGSTSDSVKYYAADVPGIPAAPIFEGATHDSISLSWSPPTYNGGISIIGYKLYMQVLDRNELVFNGYGQPQVFTFTMKGLKQGTYYNFQVEAENEVGPG